MKDRLGIETLLLSLVVGLGLLVHGCDGDDGPSLPPPNLAGTAILDLKLLEAPADLLNLTAPPADAYPGYTPVYMDLNEGTGGNYVWLYYKLGPADGSEGTPLGEIYTVDETDGEKPKSKDDTVLPNNLNSGSVVEGNRIFLAFKSSDWPVVRGIAVANIDSSDNSTMIQYAPPNVEGKYPVVWVQERKNDGWSTSMPGPWEPSPQDLNEGTSFALFYVTDYNYIGYCVDQEVYDWLQER
ncbi:MAG: hypothetical protein JXA90_04515 [Planctomycetes bacterium]|nr:hypothetical protein [Planctomycetota bacterium]